MSVPEVAILVSTFQRPNHLRRVLASIAAQEGIGDRLEVIVTDDGSTDETLELVNEFGRRAPFRVAFTTHKHGGFQLARCRNEGVAASRAPYILFLDGDCLIPRDHVVQHLAVRQQGVAWAGYCVHLDQPASERIGVERVTDGSFVNEATWGERFKLWKMHAASCFYSFINHSEKPKLYGGNIGIHRSDYELVNGYDENFVGWGCEDDDLRLRLRQAGVRVESILGRTCTYHLWHPKTPSAPATWNEGQNTSYLLRPCRLTRCGRGLTKRQTEELAVMVRGVGHLTADDQKLLPAWIRNRQWNVHPKPGAVDIEILVTGHGLEFTGVADCNLLIVPHDGPEVAKLLPTAHFVMSAVQPADISADRWFPLGDCEAVLRCLVGPRADCPDLVDTVRKAA